jgi:hypothetical protein
LSGCCDLLAVRCVGADFSAQKIQHIGAEEYPGSSYFSSRELSTARQGQHCLFVGVQHGGRFLDVQGVGGIHDDVSSFYWKMF